MTGLAMVDVDHVSSQEGGGSQPLETLFGRLCGDPHTLLCYRTISGDGIRVVFRYELDDGYDLEQQKQYHPRAFLYGNEYYRRTYGVAYDEKCKNVGRLSGLSHDPDVYYEPGAQPFTKEEIRAAAERLVRRRKEQRKRERELRRIADCYEKEIRPKVEADGAVYAAGKHNDYVMRVGYLLNQYGFDKEVAKEWANAVFREYDNVLGVIDSCYQKVEEHGILRVNNRKSHSLRSPHFSDSQPWVSVEDIKAFLTEHIQLRHNVIRGRVECKQLQTPSDSPEGRKGSGNLSPIGSSTRCGSRCRRIRRSMCRICSASSRATSYHPTIPLRRIWRGWRPSRPPPTPPVQGRGRRGA